MFGEIACWVSGVNELAKFAAGDQPVEVRKFAVTYMAALLDESAEPEMQELASDPAVGTLARGGLDLLHWHRARTRGGVDAYLAYLKEHDKGEYRREAIAAVEKAAETELTAARFNMVALRAYRAKFPSDGVSEKAYESGRDALEDLLMEMAVRDPAYRQYRIEAIQPDPAGKPERWKVLND